MHGGAAGSGAPNGNRNALRHGRYSPQAIAMRREMRALLRFFCSRLRSGLLVERLGAAVLNGRDRGTQNQAIGKSRGGLTTKIAVIVDALGNLIRFVLLPGQRHDITSFDALMAGIYLLGLDRR